MKKLSLIIFNFAILLLLFSINLKYSFAACIDSDSFDYPTINFNQQGTATSGQDSLTDYCTANVLVEYYCNSPSDDRVFNTVYNCNEGCSDGVCKEVVENPPKKSTLTESSPGGASGPVSKGQSGGGGLENNEPSLNIDSNNPIIPNTPVKSELSPKENNDANSFFGKVVKLNSGPGLIIILAVFALLILYLTKVRLTKKF